MKKRFTALLLLTVIAVVMSFASCSSEYDFTGEKINNPDRYYADFTHFTGEDTLVRDMQQGDSFTIDAHITKGRLSVSVALSGEDTGFKLSDIEDVTDYVYTAETAGEYTIKITAKRAAGTIEIKDSLILPEQLTEKALLDAGASVTHYDRSWGPELHAVEGYTMPFEIYDYSSAHNALAAFADLLGGGEAFATLTPDTEEAYSSFGKKYYRFKQSYNGLPVYRSDVIVGVDESDDRTISLDVSWFFVSELDIDTDPQVSAEKLADIVNDRYSCGIRSEPELVIYKGRLAWSILLDKIAPDSVILDADNGSELFADYPAEWNGGA